MEDANPKTSEEGRHEEQEDACPPRQRRLHPERPGRVPVPPLLLLHESMAPPFAPAPFVLLCES